jgi:calcineurin-like phosphoesterase family protein
MGNPIDAPGIIHQLNGKVHLVFGNHDRKFLKKPFFVQRFASMQKHATLQVEGRSIFLRHYRPTAFENNLADYVAFGHSHHRGMSGPNHEKSMDVGVDAAAVLVGSYRPFRLEEVFHFIDQKISGVQLPTLSR